MSKSKKLNCCPYIRSQQFSDFRVVVFDEGSFHSEKIVNEDKELSSEVLVHELRLDFVDMGESG